MERWFEQADINTCIIILQKCSDKKEREENLVRFVYLKKSLRNFIPPAQDIWEKQVERLNAIEKLKKTILAHNDFYENEELRIFPKSQKELWEEGLEDVASTWTKKESGGLKTSATEQKYVGAKWGKYLRAPQIFFKILEKGKGKLVPLKQVAKVRFGIKTGANEFFYLTEEEIKQKGIEKEFWMHKDKKRNWVPNYVIKSPRECKSIVVNRKDLKYRVLLIHKDKNDLKGLRVLKYIEDGERKKFHKRPTCESRERWYELPEITDYILCMMSINNRHIFWLNTEGCFIDARLYGIKSKKISERILTFILNSSLTCLLVELYGRLNLGEGALDVKVYEYANIVIPNPRLVGDGRSKILKEFLSSKIGSVFEELGASSPEEVSLDKVKPERRELDKIIMGEILGLTDEEQLEVYKAVVDLVKSRIEKAKSVGMNNKMVEGVNIYGIRRVVMDNLLRDGE
ncbi:MAG: hypothetical protein V1890_01885 [Candidatus Zixiibacteriota bacterium]